MKNKNKKKGMNFENKVQKTLNSGALWFDKADLKMSDYCIEVKFTEKKGFRITTQMLNKLWNQALTANKEPLLVIGIKREDGNTFLLNCKLTIE